MLTHFNELHPAGKVEAEPEEWRSSHQTLTAGAQGGSNGRPRRTPPADLDRSIL